MDKDVLKKAQDVFSESWGAAGTDRPGVSGNRR